MTHKFTSLLLCLTFGSCIHSSRSRSKHSMGELTWSPDKFQWANITKSEIMVQNDLNFQFPTDIVATSSWLQVELDSMIHKLDDMIRKKYPLEMANTPLPRVLISPESNPYAESLTARVCVNAGVEKIGETDKSRFLEIGLDGFAANNSMEMPCPKVELELRDIAPVIATYNMNAEPECKLNVSQQHLEVGPNCSSIEKGAIKLSFTTNSPFILVTAGLLVKLSQAELYSVLAHELGHYYRAHAIWRFAKRYDFLYFRKDHHPAKRPIESKSAEALSMLEELNQYAYMKLVRPQFTGDQFSALFAALFMRDQHRKYLSELPNCQVFKNDSDSINLAEISSLILAGVTLVDSKLELEKSKLSDFENCLKKNSPFSEKTLAVLVEGLQSIFELRELPFQFSNVEELRDQFMKVYSQRAIKREKIFQKITDSGLGWYTTEQEADEIALELLSLAKIDLNVLTSALFKVSNSREYRDLNGLTEEQCLDLEKRDWKVDGKEISLFYGDLSDPHHSTCYRMWNIFQELKAHQYEASETFKESSKWQESHTLIANSKLTSGARPGSGGHFFLGGCAYGAYPRLNLKR